MKLDPCPETLHSVIINIIEMEIKCKQLNRRMIYELFQSLRSSHSDQNKTCFPKTSASKTSLEIELIVMSISVSLVIILVLIVILIVLCHNTKVKNLDNNSVTDSIHQRSGPSSPESGFIDDNNLLQVPQLFTKDSAKGRRPSVVHPGTGAFAKISRPRSSRPKSARPSSGRPLGKPKLPELDF